MDGSGDPQVSTLATSGLVRGPIQGRSMVDGRTPVASDCERDRETLLAALGGEWGSGCWRRAAGDVDGVEVGENVGKGDVDCERDGTSSSVCDESVLPGAMFLGSCRSPAEKLLARVAVPPPPPPASAFPKRPPPLVPPITP